MFTEQIVKGIDEIESIKIEKNRISVITKNLFKVLGPKKTILSGCGGSTSFIDAGKTPEDHSQIFPSVLAAIILQQAICSRFGYSPHYRGFPHGCPP